MDVIMFRLSETRHTDAMLQANARGVRVRMIVEPDNYRDRRLPWHAYNIDRLYVAGIPVKGRKHAGLTNERAVILRGLGEVIFGSSDWSREAGREEGHNLFTTRDCTTGKWCDSGGSVFEWFARQFDGKWNATTEFERFAPLPPDPPAYVAPADGAAEVSDDAGSSPGKEAPGLTGTTCTWAPIRTTSLSLRATQESGARSPERIESFGPAALAPLTTYYWRVVSRTMANLSAAGPTWRFRTEDRAAAAVEESTTTEQPITTAQAQALSTYSSVLSVGDIVLWAADGAPVGSDWKKTSSRWAAGGYKFYNPDLGASRTDAPVANPSSYVELTFTPKAGKDYRLWIRAAADGDDYRNDSVSVQFNNSLLAGRPAFLIGTTSGLNYTLQNCTGAPLAAVGWSDAGGFSSCTPGSGTVLRFDTSTSPARIRIQKRQDRVQIDQVVIADASTGIPGAMINDTTPPYPRNSVDSSGSTPDARACDACRSVRDRCPPR